MTVSIGTVEKHQDFSWRVFNKGKTTITVSGHQSYIIRLANKEKNLKNTILFCDTDMRTNTIFFLVKITFHRASRLS